MDFAYLNLGFGPGILQKTQVLCLYESPKFINSQHYFV